MKSGLSIFYEKRSNEYTHPKHNALDTIQDEYNPCKIKNGVFKFPFKYACDLKPYCDDQGKISIKLPIGNKSFEIIIRDICLKFYKDFWCANNKDELDLLIKKFKLDIEKQILDEIGYENLRMLDKYGRQQNQKIVYNTINKLNKQIDILSYQLKSNHKYKWFKDNKDSCICGGQKPTICCYPNQDISFCYCNYPQRSTLRNICKECPQADYSHTPKKRLTFYFNYLDLYNLVNDIIKKYGTLRPDIEICLEKIKSYSSIDGGEIEYIIIREDSTEIKGRYSISNLNNISVQNDLYKIFFIDIPINEKCTFYITFISPCWPCCGGSDGTERRLHFRTKLESDDFSDFSPEILFFKNLIWAWLDCRPCNS